MNLVIMSTIKHDVNDQAEKNPRKLDRRVVRTRQLLRDALLAEIIEKGYDAVTVQDITDRANLGRATFYVHYDDKEDLLIQALTEVFDELVAQSGGAVPDGTVADRPTPAEITFRHAAQNKMLYQVMLNSGGATLITRKIERYIADVTRQMILSVVPESLLPIPVDILAHTAAGSLMALLTWWLESDLPYTPEYMAETFRKLHLGRFVQPGASGQLTQAD